MNTQEDLTSQRDTKTCVGSGTICRMPKGVLCKSRNDIPYLMEMPFHSKCMGKSTVFLQMGDGGNVLVLTVSCMD